MLSEPQDTELLIAVTQKKCSSCVIRSEHAVEHAVERAVEHAVEHAV